jgi:DNA uptake protein ComE-like DNA-binding protein
MSGLVRTPRSRNSWWIALTVVPFGFTTWAAFLYLGLRTKRPSLFAAAGGYGALLVGYLVLDTDDARGGRVAIGAVLAIGTWVGGFIHAMAIRRSIAAQLSLGEDPAIAAAAREIERRNYGRRMIRTNPALARQAGVGRPDLASGDSFGLIDVNHATALALTELPGMTEAMANKVACFCRQGGSFVSVEDLAVFLDFPATGVDALRDRAVFIRDP